MKLINYSLVLLSLFSVAQMNACAMTIVNNSLDPVIVTTNDGANSIFVLLAGEEKEFGDHHVKAKFTLLLRDEAGNYVQHIAVRQYACFAGKEIRLKTQDIAAQKLNENLFVFGKPGSVEVRMMEFCH